jgi:hypothetical protein
VNWRKLAAQVVLFLVTPFALISHFGLWLVERLVGERV